MGGARLKSKYQTKEVYRNVESSIPTGKPISGKKKKVKRIKDIPDKRDQIILGEEHTKDKIQSKLMARRL